MSPATSRSALVERSAARPGPPVFRFSTEDYLPQERLAAWREVLCGGVHVHLDVEPLDGAPPRATVELHRWGGTSLYFSETTPVRALRTARLVRDGDGDFRLLRAEGAGYRFTAQGVDQIVPDGGAALLSNGVVSAVEYLGPCRVTAIRMSRAALAAAVRGFDDRPIRCIAPDATALRLIAGYAEAMRRESPAADPVLAAQAARHLTDLAVLALGATENGSEGALNGVRAARLREIKADVEKHLATDGLSVAAVAERQRLPVRYVQRLFEEDSITFTEFVRERRLARAYDMLIDPRSIVQPIGLIAFEAGFTNQAYFNRTFRSRYGAAPSDIRAQVRRDCMG
jgi:AraC-like DNA-binding protein